MQKATEAVHPKRSQSGFTLLELMITLAVAGTILALAVPSMRAFSQNNRLAGASNDLLRSFQIARSEAIKSQQNVVMCASSNPTATTPTCSYGAFSAWIVFQDNNFNWQHDSSETVVEAHTAVDATMTVRNDKNGIASFNPTGFANLAGVKTPTANIVICDVRGIVNKAGSSTARALLITQTGRARVTKINSEVLTAATATGSACP